MKVLSTSEKLNLIRYHGQCLASAGNSLRPPLRSEMLDSANRVIELIKSIPKIELDIE